MKRLFFIVLLCCFWSSMVNDAIAMNLEDYYTVTEADKARAEADKAYAKAKLKDAQSYTIWAKFKKNRLENLPKDFFRSFREEVGNEKYSQDKKLMIKNMKKLIKTETKMIKSDSETVKAYAAAANAYDKTVKMYAKIAAIEDTENLKDTAKINVFAEAAKVAKAYARAARAYIESTMVRVEFDRINRANSIVRRDKLLDRASKNCETNIDDYDKSYDKIIKTQIVAFEEEAKAIKFQSEFMLNFEYK